MVLVKEFLFLTILLANSCVAINLNIFSFNKAPIKNETKPDISIKPTTTLTTPIKITKSPALLENESSSPINQYPSVDYEKHEFENETEGSDASPESNAESSPPVHLAGGQEIDETRNSSKYSVTERVDESNSSNAQEKFTLTPYWPSAPKITLPKLPSLPKKKTITFTKTLVSKFTKFEIVYPSCLKIQDVKSICDGTLITIQPTPTEWSQNAKPTSSVILDDENESYDIIEPPENRKRRTANTSAEIKKDSSVNSNVIADMIEPSELDYEFEDNTQGPTPTSEKLFNGITKPSSVLESLLINEPKVEFVTEYLSITAVQTVTDYAATATVIAHNCVPLNNNLKSCSKPSKFPTTISVLPVLYNQKNTTAKPFVKKQQVEKNQQKLFLPTTQPKKVETAVLLPEKPYNVLDQLNQYIIMNAERLMGNSGYETVDLNAESTIIEPAYPPYLEARAKRAN